MDPVTNGLIFGTLAGIILGLWPLLKGFNANQQALGIAGFFASTISGTVLGLILCVPVAWVFAWQIKKNLNASAAENNDTNQ